MAAKKVGELIKEARTKAGLSQEALAKQIDGVSATDIGKAERGEKELTQAIENLTKEKTIIMIAHRLKTVRNADQIIVIDKGRIVQQGSHEKLMQEKGIYKSFISGRKKAVSWKLA